ncbi:hypothetical protein [Asticcacaulis excentricus]|uniref:Uncharacterized protein n=1 Tax=Asticcacaulis excentricus (strain ATCC 15261 / DSM 4724 / KCTC 12464 / NCIMB 9791 / VKM B-1370 / CB 48) TaxID=573065 RepID=E8RKI3_ASTEC|nr:hypothetical protein [Asticcacaulis excentricus]ADU12463.1 hypothetical protein Astex_0778 [Asticcacaulis excentricus CB 48]
MTSAKTRQLPFAIAFAILSFLTVALGALTLQQAGLSAGLWLRNPVAWLVGGGLFLGLSRVVRPSVALVWPALILLGLCFVFPGQDGVHRWLALGPVQLNAAALILPLVLTATRTERPSSMWLIGLGLITACLAWQPDRSQLLAFSVAALVLIAQTYSARALLWATPVAALALALCLWRPDPLMPVAHVEGAIHMAAAQSPLLTAALSGALALTALSPLWLWPDESRRPQAIALSLYFALSAVAWLYGAYPVPLAGYGLGFVLGWWLGVAGLFARSPAQST